MFSPIINELLNNIQSIPKKFVTSSLEKKIISVVSELFPVLNADDKKLLSILTIFLIDIISFKNFFNNKDERYYLQWIQNNNRDIKVAISLLLPFIDDKDNMKLYKELENLNQLLYAYPEAEIPKFLYNKNREDILNEYFKFGNMGIGLIPDTNDKRLYDLYNDYDDREEVNKIINKLTNDINRTLILTDNDYNKLIYRIIHNHFKSSLEIIDITNGKTYVNWLNILPYDLQTYHDTPLYINTFNGLINYNGDVIETLSNNQINYNGLWFGDFYNVLRNRYYEEIKKIKWLIFPYEIKKIYLISGLNNLIDLDKILSLDKYISLNNYDKTYFQDKINNLLNRTLDDIDYEILKYTILFFVNNSSINNDLNKFKLENIDNDESQDDFNKSQRLKIRNITINDITEAIKIIYNKYIAEFWDYLKDSLEAMRYSALGKFLIKNNKINNYYNYLPLNDNQRNIYNSTLGSMDTINLKNIYNIAKIISHNEKWELLDNNFYGLSRESKISVLNNCLRPDISKFNIRGNLRRQYINMSINIEERQINIIQLFNRLLINIIFEELITTGILSRFEVNLELTDKSKMYSEGEKKKLMAKHVKRYNMDNCYYYLNNQPYNNLAKIRVEDGNTFKERSFIDLVIEDYSWYKYYAMDWMLQLGFFKHYINHQIIFITGSTGQGKSTQVPKLLLYSMKMFDYKSSGKIICSVPRISPTVENSTRISYELGVPIEVPTYFKQKINTDNYHVQYKYKSNSHINNNINHNMLRITTDGTLLEEILTNPTLYKKEGETFINKSLYDIVIVDEAHEHNDKMDLILTLCRQYAMYNNKFRLIITSATMETDEPVYRKYFNIIHDIDLYPKKGMYIDPILKEDTEINNYYLDRRYHISPVGETTQYKITEYYDDTFKNTNENIESPLFQKKVQKLGYEKIKYICNMSKDGHILFFVNGRFEISEAVTELNTILPSNVIALPYYGLLDIIYKDIIVKIDSKIKNIINKRENIIEEWTKDYEKPKETVPEGTYTRAVIVATNVAEASLTISGLLYVVDNGYAKENKYYIETNITELKPDKISESSRIQRKGRVGRISEGTVYYLYEKGGRQNIKPKYKITQDSFNYQFIKLLGSNNGKNIIQNNISLRQIYMNNFNRELIIPTLFSMFDNGQSINNVKDTAAKFYIVHPFENNFSRNYQNIPVEQKEAIRIDYIYYYLFSKNLIQNNKNIVEKNIITDNLIKLMSILELETIEDGLTILYSFLYKSFDIVYDLLNTINLIHSYQSNKDRFNNIIINFDDYKKGWNYDSDIMFLYDLINKIKKEFDDIIRPHDNSQIKKIYRDYLKYRQISIDPPENFDINIWNTLNNLRNKGELDNYELYIKTSTTIDISKYRDRINNWSKKNSFKYDFINKLINGLIKWQRDKEMIKTDEKIKEILQWSSSLESSFYKLLTEYTTYEIIIRPFIHANPTNIIFDNRMNNQYMTLIYSSPLYILNYTEDKEKEYMLGTLAKKREYMFFIKYDKAVGFESNKKRETKLDQNQISIKIYNINRIDLRWLLSAAPNIYNPINKYSNNIYLDNMLSEFQHNISKIWSPNYNPLMIDDKLEMYYKEINNKILYLRNNKN